MNNFKSSYELALERIIVPKKNNTKNNRNSSKMIDSALPDFIEAWKPPHGKDDFKDICLEMDGSNETKSLIQHYNNLNIQNQKDNSQVQESSKKNYNDYPTIELFGDFMTYNTQSRINRKLAFSLSNKGILVKTNIQDLDNKIINEQTKEKIHEMSKLEVKNNSPKIYSYLVNQNHLYGNKNIFYAIKESEKTLDKNKLFKINNIFDEIWVTKESLKKYMFYNGIEKEIHVMPFGVDYVRYNPKRKQFDFKQDLNEFIFLSILDWEYSSGYDLMLKAFIEEFSEKDNVSLLIASKDNRQKIIEKFNKIKNKINKNQEELPHIALYDKFIKEKDMPNIYGASDAFILTPRKEISDIKYKEAASSGLPIIASDYSGNSEIINKNNCYLVNLKENENLTIIQIREYLRYIYENYEASLEKSMIFRKKLIENFSWDMTINKVYKRIIKVFEK